MRQYNFLNIPPIHEIENNFLIMKGIKKGVVNLSKNSETETINWDYIFKDKNYIFKCRVDNKKKVNVIFQNSFHFDIDECLSIMLQCADLFYKNEYPIFIIESNNNGGMANLHMMMHQIFQIRTANKAFYSYLMNEKSKKYVKKNLISKINLETCKVMKSYEDLRIITDYYDYNGLNITHKRSNAIDYISLGYRKALANYRKKYINSKYIKKPTDILIFTDAYSYSATSGLIKNFQNTGAGIVVGYFGNPKIKGIDLFDSSQSSATINYYDDTEIENKLKKLGIDIGTITFLESFDISMEYDNKTLIPREYQFDPVDERIDIFSHYSDNIYDKFIDEGLKIHNKYNTNNKCNPKNERLLFHDNKCQKFTAKGLEYAHGGYKCNQNGDWDKSKCFPYYCDIGYFYDRNKNKCIKECSYESESFFLYQKDYSEEIIVNKKETYEYFIISKKNNYYYLFESTEDDAFYQYPRIFAINGSDAKTIIVNKFRNATKNITIKISSLNSDITYYVEPLNAKYDEFIVIHYWSKINFIKFDKDYIFYLKRFSDTENNDVTIAQYDNYITFNDIQNINDKYFKNYNGGLYLFEKGKSYALSFNYKNKFELVDYYLSPVDINPNIELNISKTNYLYLKKNIRYHLIVKDKTINRALKLSRNSLNSEVVILENNNILNSNNLYYILNNNQGELNLEVKNEDAFIEILYYFSNIEVYNFDNLEFEFSAKYNLIKIPRKYGFDKIQFKVSGNINSSYSIHNGYGINNYNYYRTATRVLSSHKLDFIVNEPYGNEITLMENEYYNLLFMVYKGKITLKINIDKNIEDENYYPGRPNKGLFLKMKMLYIMIILTAFLIY